MPLVNGRDNTTVTNLQRLLCENQTTKTTHYSAKATFQVTGLLVNKYMAAPQCFKYATQFFIQLTTLTVIQFLILTDCTCKLVKACKTSLS